MTRRPRTADEMRVVQAAVDRIVVRCVYCNQQMPPGPIGITMEAHELICPDRHTVERQQQRAVKRFQRKRVGFA